MSDINKLLESAKNGFASLEVGQKYKDVAIESIKEWLSNDEFKDYVPSIEHLINTEDWDYLLDCFYQVIPFGTGGRRGEVGIGPNKINKWTIQASAQGHSQFLINKYGEDAKQRGVVLAYDVRQFFGNKHYDDNLSNPVKDLSSKDLATAAAETYAANGIKVYFFEDVRTTPELSFAIRHLKAVAGDMFSASHNPPDFNGKKVYDEFGGQLIPPHDEELVKEVTEKVSDIKRLDFEESKGKGLVEIIASKVDSAYMEALKKLSLSDKRSANILFTPLHGCGGSSVAKVLKELGFNTTLDPKTSNPSGKFENVTFNIPNPEVKQSFENTIKEADKSSELDLIIATDPDADRMGVEVKHEDKWVYLNGNEIGSILTSYAVEKLASKAKMPVVVKTTVTSNLISEIAKAANAEVIGELLVGFKYIGEEMNKLESKGRMGDFLIGMEESHGYIAGNYARDKDGAVGAIWLAELASELKDSGKTLVDYLNGLYTKYGYFKNFQSEIRLPGAEGMEQIAQIQAAFRKNPPKKFGEFQVGSIEDCLDRKPIVSETDRGSKNVLIFKLKPMEGFNSMKITVRPSGTEPKSKMYYELGTLPVSADKLNETKSHTQEVLTKLEKAFMLACYEAIGIDFPDRGFLLFGQIPLFDKLKYFEIEPQIEALKAISDSNEKKEKLAKLLAFLGSDPVEKVDQAFIAKNKVGIKEYLKI